MICGFEPWDVDPTYTRDMESVLQDNRATVLVIEDDEQVSGLLVRVLKREGYLVTHAADGAAGKSHIEDPGPQGAPQVILLDLSLPFVDGLTLLDCIANSPHCKDTSTIVLSGKAQEHQITKALSLGADDYVTKPFQLGELMARVQRALRKR